MKKYIIAIILSLAIVSVLQASTITTIQPTDIVANSRATLNTNFANLNSDKLESSALAPYLTTISAAATYLTQANAASTYQPIGAYLTTIAGLNNNLLTNGAGYLTTISGLNNNLLTNGAGYLTNLLGGLNAVLGDATTTNLTISGVTNSYLATNSSGKVIATTTPITLTSLSNTATGLTYTNTTGVTSLTSGYTIPQTASIVATTSSNTWAGTQTFSTIKTSTTSAYCAFGPTGILIATTTPSVGTPAGSNTQIQFNNNGVFGGAGFNWDGSKITAGGTLIIEPNTSNDSSYALKLGLNTDYSTLDGATFWSDGGDPVFSIDAVNAGLIVGKTYASSEPSLASPANGMVIQGKVGIGTSTPATTLVIVGTTTLSSGASYTNKVVCYLATGALGHCDPGLSCTCLAN